MVDNAKKHDYTMYLQTVKEYESSQIKTHGKICSTCKFYEIAVVDEHYKSSCKIFGFEKKPQEKCFLWKFAKVKRYTEAEFYAKAEIINKFFIKME